MIYRKLIISSYLILFSTVLLLEKSNDVVPEFIIAIFGIATTITVLFSPILVGMALYNFKLSGPSLINILFLFLATLYLSMITVGIYKIWPQLMGV